MTDATRFFSDLVRVETRFYNAVSDGVRAAHGLSLGQFELLAIVDRIPGCRVLDIVREVAITVGAASKAVDRLEDAGWCRREAHPDDRRSSLITLTPEGRRLLEAARPTVEDEISSRLVGIPPDALAWTAATLGTLRAALEDEQLGRGRPPQG